MADSLTVLTTPLGKQPLVCRMKTFDALSQPFRYELELVSPGSAPERGTPPEIRPGDLLGKAIAVHLRGRDAAKTVRHFHGYVVEFQIEDLHPTELRERLLYRVVLRPWLWLLGLRTNCRVFKDLSVVDIAKKICKEHGFGDLIVDKRRQSPAPLEYVVQYNESDLAFVSRLLEREGIYYYFVHSESKHQLVLADDPTSHTLQTENAEYPSWYNKVDEYRKITVWNMTNNLRPMEYRLDDYDFARPTTELKVKLKTDQQNFYEKGKQFEYPGGYNKEAVGKEYVKYVLQAQNAPAAYVSGEAKAIALASGQTFTATVSPDREYLITRTEGDFFFNSYAQQDVVPLEQKMDGVDIAPDVTFKFTAVDKAVPFRPERLTPRPVIAGLQTAKVVGNDNGAPEGSIHIDEHGRVMVKFHWLGPAAEGEDAAVERSCWVRVAQAWAGNAWGAQFTPRVGSEVVISFEEGDPNRPLVVGSVYNGLWQAPFTQSDGAVNGTISGVRTDRAVNGGASEAEPNVLKLDDTKGTILMKSEEVGVKAIKNANIEGETVGLAGGIGGQSKVDVGGAMQTITLSCPFTLTLQTPRAQIELGPRGVVILGNLMVNNAIYPLPATPVQIAAAVAELGVDFTKDMVMDAALGGGVDDDEPSPGAQKAPEGAMLEDEGVADMD
jgi:type VI secretion system secreted protein VgrG